MIVIAPTFTRLLVATLALIVLAGVTGGSQLAAQQANRQLSTEAAQQITSLLSEKISRTPAQRKISSQLIYAAKMQRGEPIAAGVASLRVQLPDLDQRGVVGSPVSNPVGGDARNIVGTTVERGAVPGVVVDVRAEITDTLLGEMRALGAELLHVSVLYHNVRLRIDLQQLESLAALPGVTYIQPKQEAMTSRIEAPIADPARSASSRIDGLLQQKPIARRDLVVSVRQSLEGGATINSVGSVSSEGDAAHSANIARATYGVSGAGVKIGVLSDGVSSLAQSQALGDLGAVTVLSGQGGSGDEGTAMLEIIHDLAPGADLFFATAFTSLASFAENIRALSAAGCDIIVDDVTYNVESPFQDGQTYTSLTNGGIVVQAVNEVAAAGTLYFSSAANSGNKDDGQSGTWEGNFVDGGAAGGPLAGAGQLHDFGGQTYDILTASSSNLITLFWSDPLGTSANDYDLFILSPDGTQVFDASTNYQSGTQDPFEQTGRGFAGERIVIVKFAGSARFLHLSTNGNRLQISTAGDTRGHAAASAANAFGVAATPARDPYTAGTAPGPYPGPFNAGDTVETFSSDGPRHLFFNGDGTAFTPGNVLSGGGVFLQKPDFAAADGVSVSGVGGFPTPFYGTAASASHAAAIAALVKSRNPAQTATQVRTALFSSAVDIEAPGADRDSGVGIIMADAAVGAATLRTAASTTSTQPDLDSDARTDLTVFRPSTGTWYVRYSSHDYDVSDAGTFQWGLPGDVPISGDFDGDGQTDLTVFRPSTGIWYIRYSSLDYSIARHDEVQWGWPGDVPLAGDFDGDGRTELTVFRPSTGTWYIRYSSLGYGTAGHAEIQWGLPGDVPIVADFDGDGRAELTVFRPSTGTWHVRYSSLGYSLSSYQTFQWGLPGDIPIAGDFDGDRQTELAVYRPSSGGWFIRYSSRGYSVAAADYFQWGLPGDLPVTAEFDGDGKTEITIFRPSTAEWFVRYSSAAFGRYAVYQWGLPGDSLIQ